MLAEAENLQHSCTVVVIYDHVRSNVQPVKPALAVQHARSVYMDNRNTNAVTGQQSQRHCSHYTSAFSVSMRCLMPQRLQQQLL